MRILLVDGDRMIGAGRRAARRQHGLAIDWVIGGEAVPRPRLHLMRFHRVLAPNAKLRALCCRKGQDNRGGRPESHQAPNATPSRSRAG